jgi:hypothetical protein
MDHNQAFKEYKLASCSPDHTVEQELFLGRKYERNLSAEALRAKLSLNANKDFQPWFRVEDGTHTHHAMYIQDGVVFVPLLFDPETLLPLLYCNAELNLEIVPTELRASMQAGVISSGTLAPLACLPIFRPEIRDQFPLLDDRKTFRFAERHGLDPTGRIATLKLQLNQTVKRIADAIQQRIQNLPGYLATTPSQFFNCTVNNIYRRNIVPLGPKVRQFARWDMAAHVLEMPEWQDEPYGKPTDKYYSIVRCVHRLLNTRLLSASMALMGTAPYVTTTNRIVPGHGLTDDQLDTWIQQENLAIERYTQFHDEDGARVTAQEQSHFSEANATATRAQRTSWWHEPVGYKDGFYTAAQVFPHMSQRLFWTEEALKAFSLVSNPDNVLMIQLRDHLIEDLTNALQ